jgi:hypothetical protein
MPPKIARLAGLGAFGAVGGMLGLFALLAFVTRPPSDGGILPGLSWVAWIAFAVIFAALIGAHIAIGKQLLAIGKGEGARPI